MRVLESVLYGEDLVAARAFYTGVLGMEEISFDPARDLFLKCDTSVVIIFKASKTMINDAVVPGHGTVGAGHIAFAASEEELVTWEDRLVQNGIEITKKIAWRNGAHSIYFNDPAGNVVEFATPSLWGLT